MLRLTLRLLPVMVSLSVFVVFITVLPVAGQSPAMPLLYTTPPFAPAQFDPWELATTGVAAQSP